MTRVPAEAERNTKSAVVNKVIILKKDAAGLQYNAIADI